MGYFQKIPWTIEVTTTALNMIKQDDYKDEYLPNLQRSTLYQSLLAKCGDKDQEVIISVHKAVSFAQQRTKTILTHMGEYTLHDEDHLFRVLYLMELLITEENIELLSIPEQLLLILSAFLHDIGMAPSEKEILEWKTFWDVGTNNTETTSESYQHFKRFILSHPEQNQAIRNYQENSLFSKANEQTTYLIADYIRATHAHRSLEIIDKEMIFGEAAHNRVLFRKKDLTSVLGILCKSHNEDPAQLWQLEKNILCAQNTFVCLPIIAIILRLADLIDFDSKRTPEMLFSHLHVRHPVSLMEWQKHRSIEAWNITPDFIQYAATCEHPAIEASIHRFLDIIDSELGVCANMLTQLNDLNKNIGRALNIKIPLKVNREKISAKKDIYQKPLYLYRDTKFSLSKKQIIDLLMGTKLYGNPEIALRELLQNAIDACSLRKVLEESWNNPYLPEIKIKYYLENGQSFLEVSDNGIGMDQYVIDHYFTHIGSSFYKSVDFNQLLIDHSVHMQPTSRFGIGILSCFMISDSITIETMKAYAPYKSSDALQVTIEGQDSIFWIKSGQLTKVGTICQLTLREKDNPWKNVSGDDFIKFVDKLFPNPAFTLTIEAGGKRTNRDRNSFKQALTQSRDHYYWQPRDFVKMIAFSFEGKHLTGFCQVAILEDKEEPFLTVETKVAEVSVGGRSYPMLKQLDMKDNEIKIQSTSIGTDHDGNITTHMGYQMSISSKSTISLHGIEIDYNLFPASWRTRKNQVRLEWPFPILLVVDVGGDRDLDLNAARTEILVGAKWDKIEQDLACLICLGIEKTIETEKWEKFRTNVLAPSLYGSAFMEGLRDMERELAQPSTGISIELLPPFLQPNSSDDLPF